MSDPNQPPSYPGPEQPPTDPQAYPPPPSAYPPPPSAYPPPPSAYPTQPPAYPTPPPAYGQQPPPPPGYGQQYPPAYGQPQYGAPQYPQNPYGQTPYYPPAQNPYVHWGLRFAALLLDSAMLLPFYISGVIGVAMYEDLTLTEDTQNLGLGIAIAGYVALLGFSIWNQVLRQGRTGSSLGKQIVGIALISEQTGTPIGGWKTFGRQFVHLLDGIPCYLGYFWPLWDIKRQTFADKIMNTIVVKRAPAQPQMPAYPAPPQQY